MNGNFDEQLQNFSLSLSLSASFWIANGQDNAPAINVNAAAAAAATLMLLAGERERLQKRWLSMCLRARLNSDRTQRPQLVASVSLSVSCLPILMLAAAAAAAAICNLQSVGCFTTPLSRQTTIPTRGKATTTTTLRCKERFTCCRRESRTRFRRPARS